MDSHSTVKTGIPCTDAPSVADYFADQLGYELPGTANRRTGTDLAATMSIATLCGKSCRGAIDAAATLLTHVTFTFGDPRLARAHPKSKFNVAAIVQATADVVNCYIYG